MEVMPGSTTLPQPASWLGGVASGCSTQNRQLQPANTHLPAPTCPDPPAPSNYCTQLPAPTCPHPPSPARTNYCNHPVTVTSHAPILSQSQSQLSPVPVSVTTLTPSQSQATPLPWSQSQSQPSPATVTFTSHLPLRPSPA